MGYKVVCWPQSQNLMGVQGFYENCFLINTPNGLERFGSCAYLVDSDWLEKLENGELDMMTEEEENYWANKEDEWGVVDESDIDNILFSSVEY